MTHSFRYMPTAFISGTFADMEEWRDEVCKALIAVGIHPVDLAKTADRHEPVANYIHRELDETHLLVGIYGVRYGSTVGNDDRPPSWSHLEYVRHQYRVSQFPHDSMRPETIVLFPTLGSPASLEAISNAEKAYDDEKKSAEERAKDKERQRRFIGVLRGDEPDFSNLFEDETRVASKPQAVLVSSFTDTAHLRFQIVTQVCVLGISQRIKIDDEPSPERKEVRERETATAFPTLKSEVLKKLTPEAPPAGLCLIVPKIGDFSAEQVAESITDQNPWHVGRLDQKLSASGYRGADLTELIRAYAQSDLGVSGEDLNELAKNIAAEIASCDQTEVFRFDNMARGHIKQFVTDVWPKLETALVQGRKAAGPEKAGLVLLFSSDGVDPGRLKTQCQMASDKTCAAFSKPVFLDEKAFELPRTTIRNTITTGNPTE